MNGHEIRRKFLEYFERNGHKIVHSSPLLPANDPTLLFTNAGMNQFKDVFLGNEKREYTRAVSSQKCIRAGGKHNDLDEVGKTARHHTFFEMLGNFSFGDYFKEDAIKYAWDFLVNELKLDPERLWFSVFEGDDEVPADDEARKLWEKVGAKPDRILGFGRKDNFWQMGDTGPCGPCSEIHYYMGEDMAGNLPEFVNGPGDTTMEIWNLVFMQFVRSEVSPGVFKLDPLPAPSVDTGAGLERLSAVMQGVKTNYDTDLLLPIIEFTAKLCSKEYAYESQEGFAMRVVADHARSTAFAIADGILPGNEGRNYVLRKIMRRAIYNGREHLGFDGPFFHKVCDFVVGEMGGAFPELIAQRDFIAKMVLLEEERFGNTLTAGKNKFEDICKEAISEISEEAEVINSDSGASGRRVIIKVKGDVDEKTRERIERLQMAFETRQQREAELVKQFFEQNRKAIYEAQEYKKLLDENEQAISTAHEYEKLLPEIKFLTDLRDLAKIFAPLRDTYGYPPDLIRIGLEQKGFMFSATDFDEELEAAIVELQQSSEIGKTHRNEKINPIYAEITEKTEANVFRGYESTSVENAKVLGLVKADAQVDSLSEGEEGLVILNETPFYAESGGQVGDTGSLSNAGAGIRVLDTYSPVAGLILHKSKIEKGSIKVGDTVTAQVDVQKRDATRRNHTATHLVHAALREVLGTHVKQAGSVVAPNYLRFDFTHYQPMSATEIKEIEDLVNRYILENHPVNTDLMSIEDAMRSGAMALFGEKYGGEVRVLSVGNGEFSRELCGGTHVRATGDIGTFKITNDEAIASGVRRIRAITGFDSLERFREDELLIERSLGALKTQRDNLPVAIEKLQEELKKTRKEMDELKLKIASGSIGGAAANGDEAKDVAGIKLIAKLVEGLDAGGMRQLSDNLLDKMKSGVVVLGRKEENKVSIIVRVSDDLTKRIQAGKVIGELAPIIGGRGGGKPDMAEGGGNLPEKLSEAIDASAGVIEKMLG